MQTHAQHREDAGGARMRGRHRPTQENAPGDQRHGNQNGERPPEPTGVMPPKVLVTAGEYHDQPARGAKQGHSADPAPRARIRLKNNAFARTLPRRNANGHCIALRGHIRLANSKPNTVLFRRDRWPSMPDAQLWRVPPPYFVDHSKAYSAWQRNTSTAAPAPDPGGGGGLARPTAEKYWCT